VILGGLTFAADAALASHPWLGSNQSVNVNFLFPDFEPGGDGRIIYRLCNNTGSGLPPTWQGAVEKWDSASPTMEFDPVTSCGAATNAMLRWEVNDECGGNPQNWACWRTPTDPTKYTPHGNHMDIILGEIAVDYTQFAALDDEDDDGDLLIDWEVYVISHEWGHNLSLADHGGSDCAAGTLMGNYFNVPPPVPPDPCFPRSTGGDRHSVSCVVYKRWCSPTIMAGNWGNASGLDDLAVWRPTGGIWDKRGVGQVQFGLSTDVPAPGLFSADAVMDPAVFRHCLPPCSSAQSYWYTEGICIASLPGVQCADYNGNTTTDGRVPWGQKGDVPVAGYYDADNRADFAVWRPGDGFWHIRYQNGQGKTVQFGLSTDIPVPGDYDGNGTTDVAVWRPETGFWLLENVTITGATYGDFNGNGTTDSTLPFGLRGDIPAQGNYYGDAKTEPAVWRSCSPPCAPPNLAYLLIERAAIPGASYGDFNGNASIDSQIQWGLAPDLPATGDYAFGLADPTVWHPCPATGGCLPSSSAYWFVDNVTIPGGTHGDFNLNGTSDSQVQWGQAGDIPLAGRQGR